MLVTWHLYGNLQHRIIPAKARLVANAKDYLWSSAAGKAEMTLGSAGLTA